MTKNNYENQPAVETRKQKQFAMPASNDAYYAKLERLREYHWQEVTEQVAAAGQKIAAQRAEHLKSWGLELPADVIFRESEASREVVHLSNGVLTFTDMHLQMVLKREDADAVKRDKKAGGPIGAVYDKNQVINMDAFRHVYKDHQLVAAVDVYWTKEQLEQPTAIELVYTDAAQNGISELVCKTDNGWVRLEKRQDGSVTILERLSKYSDPQEEFSRLHERLKETQHIQTEGPDAVAEYACVTDAESTPEVYLHLADSLCEKARQLQSKYAGEIASLQKKITEAPAEARPEVESQIRAIQTQLPGEIEKVIEQITKTGHERAAQFEIFKHHFKQTRGDRYEMLLATKAKEIPDIKSKIFEVSETLRKFSLQAMLAEEDTLKGRLRRWLRNI